MRAMATDVHDRNLRCLLYDSDDDILIKIIYTQARSQGEGGERHDTSAKDLCPPTTSQPQPRGPNAELSTLNLFKLICRIAFQFDGTVDLGLLVNW